MRAKGDRMRHGRSTGASAVLVVAFIWVAAACSSSSTTSTAAGTSSTTTAATSTTSAGDAGGARSSGGGTDEGNGGSGGSQSGDGGTSGGDGTTTGLAASDLEQLRSIYGNQGIDSSTTECVLTTVDADLRNEVVTQAVLEAALTDATLQCTGGGTSDGGGGGTGGGDPSLVRGIIDNYPTGGAPSSTTLVPGGSSSGNYPTGG